MIHSALHCEQTERGGFLILHVFSSSAFCETHCLCLGMHSSDKVQSTELSILVGVVTLQGAIRSVFNGLCCAEARRSQKVE